MLSHRATLQQLAQVIDDSLTLLRQAAIIEAPSAKKDGQPTKANEPVGSLLEQCMELCAQHQAATQEPIRLIYHFGLPENSSLIASLATLANTKVMTDVYPGSSNFEHQLKKQTIAPISLKGYEASQHPSVEKEQWAQWFLNDLQQRHQHSQQLGQRLLLVNNYCLPDQKQQDTQADLLSLMEGQVEVRAIIIVADPADSYKAYCALPDHNTPALDFESYSKRMSKFIGSHAELATFTHESYVAAPSKTLREICQQLALPFNADSENLKRVFIAGKDHQIDTLNRPLLLQWANEDIPESIELKYMPANAESDMVNSVKSDDYLDPALNAICNSENTINDPAILEIPLHFNDQTTPISLTTNRPNFFTKKEGFIYFSIPETHVYLNGRENSNYSAPPIKKLFHLLPHRDYSISGQLIFEGDSPTIFVILYNKNERIDSKTTLLENNCFEIIFHTPEGIDNFCLLLRLTGQGKLASSDISVSLQELTQFDITLRHKAMLGNIEIARQTLFKNRCLVKEQYHFYPENDDPPLVSIIIATCRPHKIDQIVENIGCQVYKNKEVIIVTQNYSPADIQLLKSKLNQLYLKESIIFQEDAKVVLGARLNNAIALAKGIYWAKMDDDDYYFANYLADMIIPFMMIDCDIVGKAAQFYYMESSNKTFLRKPNIYNTESNYISGATLVVKKQKHNILKFKEVSLREDIELLNSAKQQGLIIYATDPFNHIVWRHQLIENHTWQLNAEQTILSQSIEVNSGFVKELVIL